MNDDDVSLNLNNNSKRVDDLSPGEVGKFGAIFYDEHWQYTDDKGAVYNVYYRDGVPINTTYASGFKTNLPVSDVTKLNSALDNVSAARSAENLPTVTYTSASVIGPNSNYTDVSRREINSSTYDEAWTIKGKDGKTYTVYYKDGEPVSATDGTLIFSNAGKKAELFALIDEVRANGEKTTFGTQAFTLSAPQKSNISIDGTNDSFQIDNVQVDEVCAHLTTISQNMSSDINECVDGFFQAASEFFSTVGGGSVGPTSSPLINVMNAIDDLRDNLVSVQDALNRYANGDPSGLDCLDNFFNTNFTGNNPEPNLNPDWGPYAGPSDDYGGSSASDADHASDINTDIDASVDTDTDIAKPDTDTDLASNIPSSIAGAGIGSTLLGMATGAAGVAGSGALIDGDSVLDELDDTVVVPSTIRNSTAASIRKSKKDKVGAAVGVGVAAAAAGAGLYYYSKKAEEEENGEEEINEEDAEKAILQDDNEDGAVEFQYVSGLGSVVELKDAIMNDTL